jgi:hypothetical protein
MTDPLVPFRHSPLDHTIQSLRLVRLLPGLSGTGEIQCTITHTTTEARYVCLSYTWGEPDIVEGNHVLINGMPFPVRQNLLDFLQMMQKTAPRDDGIFDPGRGYWIDALCIDQNNTSEKIHQVAQMGSIFSKAELVHVWLGVYEYADSICPLVDGPTDSESTKIVLDWKSKIARHMDVIEACVFENRYWTRA